MATAILNQEEFVTSESSETIIRKHVLISMGVGLIPIPAADMIGITASQLSMIRKLSEKYGIPFKQNLAKSILTSLISSIGVHTLATGSVSQLMRAIPVVGGILSTLTFSGFGGALTYAVGKAFDKHFSGGGSFLDMRASDLNTYFSSQFEAGKEVAKEIKKKVI
jgi:uncharacterized protein (DUF697 family)